MRFILGGLFVAALLGSAAVSSAGDDFKPEPGYVSLFNGKDLEGWKYYKETDLKGKDSRVHHPFRADDGARAGLEQGGVLGVGQRGLVVGLAGDEQFLFGGARTEERAVERPHEYTDVFVESRVHARERGAEHG